MKLQYFLAELALLAYFVSAPTAAMAQSGEKRNATATLTVSVTVVSSVGVVMPEDGETQVVMANDVDRLHTFATVVSQRENQQAIAGSRRALKPDSVRVVTPASITYQVSQPANTSMIRETRSQNVTVAGKTVRCLVQTTTFVLR